MTPSDSLERLSPLGPVVQRDHLLGGDRADLDASLRKALEVGAAVEALPLLRRLWAGETVSHDSAVGHFKDVKLSPLPMQQPLEMWLGGTVPAATDVDGEAVTYQLVSGSVEIDGEAAADGVVLFNSDGSYSYDPSG